MLSKKNKTNVDLWDSYHGKIVSHSGGWFVGKGAFTHNHNIMEELAGNISYMQLKILNITGKIPSKALADWLEACFIGLSWPDARLWCNQIGSLTATLRGNQMAATLAGTLASDSRIYGPKTLIEGMEFIQQTFIRSQTETVEEIIESLPKSKGKPLAMGFARPIAVGDERVYALQKIADKLNLPLGKHLKLAYEIENYIFENYHEKINFGGYLAANFLDFEIDKMHVYAITSTFVSSGVTTCYLDALQNPPETFLPLRCDDIEYQGKVARNIE